MTWRNSRHVQKGYLQINSPMWWISITDLQPRLHWVIVSLLGLRCMTYNLWNSAMMLRNLPHTGVSSLCTICTAWKLSVQACQSVTLHPWMWRAVPSTVWKVGRGHLPSVSWMSWDIDLWSWSESRDKRCNFGTMWAKRVWMQSASWMNFFKSWPREGKPSSACWVPWCFESLGDQAYGCLWLGILSAWWKPNSPTKELCGDFAPINGGCYANV